MIFPDYENMKEERICQECYGYTKGDVEFPFSSTSISQFSLFLYLYSRCTAAVGKATLSAFFWPVTKH